MPYSYSIIVPAYQEAETLSPAIEYLVASCQKEPENIEIIIVENGSTDATWDRAVSLAARFENVFALRSSDKGKGAAILLGWQEASAPIVMFLDADLSAHPEVLPRLYALVKETGACALADRFLPDSNVSRSFKRRCISRLWAAGASCALPLPFMDYQCGAKALLREDARACSGFIEARDWFFDLELLLRLCERGVPLKRVPVLWRESVFEGRSSHLPIIRTSLRFLRGLARLRRASRSHR